MPDQDPAALVAATAEEIVGAISKEAERLAVFRRRWVAALRDAGLLDVVGPHWVRIGSSSIELSELSFAQADELLRRLEDLGRWTRTRSTSCSGQQVLPWG